MISSVFFPHSADCWKPFTWRNGLHTCVCAFFYHNFFFLTLCLHCVLSLVCDTVKWFPAFVRHRNVDCRLAFTASRGHRLLQQDCGLGEEISVTTFTLLYQLGNDLEEHRQCLLFTCNNNMNILAECCPTHCILHHH